MSSSSDEAEFDGGDVYQVEGQQSATFVGMPASEPASGSEHADGSESGSASSNSRKSNQAKPNKGTSKAKTSKKAPAKKQKSNAKAKKPSERGKGGKKGVAGKKPASKANGKKGGKAAHEPSSTSLDLFTKHLREFERGLTRLEKIDEFGFFLDGPRRRRLSRGDPRRAGCLLADAGKAVAAHPGEAAINDSLVDAWPRRARWTPRWPG